MMFGASMAACVATASNAATSFGIVARMVDSAVMAVDVAC
jgi:hypothetical protein